MQKVLIAPILERSFVKMTKRAKNYTLFNFIYFILKYSDLQCFACF